VGREATCAEAAAACVRDAKERLAVTRPAQVEISSDALPGNHNEPRNAEQSPRLDRRRFPFLSFTSRMGCLEFPAANFKQQIDLPLTRTLPMRSLPHQLNLQWEHLTRSKNTSELRISAYLPKAPSSHTPPQEFCGRYTNPSGGCNEE
jgi:hypothetical protein